MAIHNMNLIYSTTTATTTSIMPLFAINAISVVPTTQVEIFQVDESSCHRFVLLHELVFGTHNDHHYQLLSSGGFHVGT